MEVLDSLPIDPETSKSSDAGTPIVLDRKSDSVTRRVFLNVASKVWAKLGQ